MTKTKTKRGTVQCAMRGDDEFYSFEQWNGREWIEYAPGVHFWTKRAADMFGENNFKDYRR